MAHTVENRLREVGVLSARGNEDRLAESVLAQIDETPSVLCDGRVLALGLKTGNKPLADNPQGSSVTGDARYVHGRVSQSSRSNAPRPDSACGNQPGLRFALLRLARSGSSILAQS